MGSVLDERVLQPALDAIRSFIEARVQRDARQRARLLVAMTEAFEGHLGREEGFRVARQVHESLSRPRPGPAPEGQNRSLQAFCAGLEAGCIGTHEWTRVEDTPVRVSYRFTRCAWAELFREMGRPDIGHWFCDGDEPGARAFNPKINFRRTQVLMDGDPCCDHVFYVEPE